jgi:hypothetical protein
MPSTYRVWSKTGELWILGFISKYSKYHRKLCTNKLDIGDPIAKSLNGL